MKETFTATSAAGIGRPSTNTTQASIAAISRDRRSPSSRARPNSSRSSSPFCGSTIVVMPQPTARSRLSTSRSYCVARAYPSSSSGCTPCSTARLYSDVSFMTSNRELGMDATSFFNAITAYSQPQKFLKIEAAQGLPEVWLLE